ncbi:flavin reductase (DIM6/NTAB) family NADH-FMN oxidoreductase RutF [Altererythrobacter atlanticus]|uniref:Flavoredoxin n=1 Tax=Croceibacterium atlanticum TaxID=1267766 RepID=A0A0F7KRK5_9SPHN|nr:flavin reductase family protein [Croceibacterium atlanticum]AKH43103.1 Flavoredoxin [Croceibacterium atlanticum]MBB5732193.1 flavin reductase (DIM6/NTAB) family NADH-FMN oxidoreductase RutF [Croceibacterium atlanticum]
MQFVMEELDPAERYKLLVNTITPRPIAWVVTRDAQGQNNAAPYSFFNAMGGTPPLLAIGMAADNQREGGTDKDSLRAIRETGEFAVALVDEAHAEAMNLTACAAPPGVDELKLAGLECRPAARIAAPLIADAPVQFECRLWKLVETGPHSAIVIGEVLVTHIIDSVVGREDGKLRIDNPALKLIGRTFGAGGYVRNSGHLQIDRLRWPLEE